MLWRVLSLPLVSHGRVMTRLLINCEFCFWSAGLALDANLALVVAAK